MNYLKEVWGARELLLNLVQREIKGKYKRTIFGQLWSLANPLALMLIYTFVFGFLFRAIHPDPGNPSGLNVFALWLLCGLLPWTFFSNVMTTSASSIVTDPNLVQKVYFSRIVLPLAMVGASAYNWLFEIAILLIAISIVGGFVLPWLPLIILIMILLALFAAGVGLMLSIANVYFRDTQYFLTILVQLWIYLTPIIYPLNLVANASKAHGPLFGTPITILGIYDLNPMVHFVTVFRELIYDNRWPDGIEWILCVAWTIISLTLGLIVFRRHERRLAEVL
jgi:lipopolysaccharide transport system permease protein